MTFKNLIRLLDSTILHEWLHARELKKISGGQNVFIIYGISDKERGKKLKEEYLINSNEYQSSDFDGFSFYKRIDKKRWSSGRADVDNRSILSENEVKRALIKPFAIGCIISILGLIISVILFYLMIYRSDFLLVIPLLIVFRITIVAFFCMFGSFYGKNNDFFYWNNPKLYISALDEDLVQEIKLKISDIDQLNRGHLILDEKYYNEKLEGYEFAVAEKFNCKTISLLIDGKLHFLHITNISKLQSITENGLRMPENETSLNDTLGRGIYCYNYDEYVRGRNRASSFDTIVKIEGYYEGMYLKCVFGDASGNDNESLREYLLLSDVAEIKLMGVNTKG